MKDRYDEFKDWFKNQTDISWRATGCAFVDYDDELPFSKFEHEQEEKEKEKQVKETIRNSIERCGVRWINVDIIYKDLKEKDLLK